MIVLVFQVDFTHLRNAQGIFVGAGRQIDKGAEGRLHLLAAFEEIALVAQAHPLFGLDALAGLHTKQHLMGVGVGLFDIVDIVGRQQADTKLF